MKPETRKPTVAEWATVLGVHSAILSKWIGLEGDAPTYRVSAKDIARVIARQRRRVTF